MKLRPAFRGRAALVAVGTACAAATVGASADPAYGFNAVKPICTAVGFVSGLAGKACSVAEHGGQLLKAGKKLVTGHLGGAVKDILGEGGGAAATAATAAVGLTALVTWVVVGARYALNETAAVLGHTTSPQLETTWFSSTYWRVAGIAALLTLPFLFAASIQALVQSDLALLVRAALGYLPLAILGVTIAAPLTMLLLAASDQMSAIVAAAAGNASTHFLDLAGASIGGLSLLSHSPFLVFFAAVLTVAGAVVLWLELIMREVAVYVIVLMLPLAFAALVWPARRVWAIRAVELLIALIMSKFVIVAVLSLGGAALGASAVHSITGVIAGFALVAMAACAPWAVLRLLPMTEVASATAGSLRTQGSIARHQLEPADAGARQGADLGSTTAAMRREAAQSAEGAEGASATRDDLRELGAPSSSGTAPTGGSPSPAGGSPAPAGPLPPAGAPSPTGVSPPAGASAAVSPEEAPASNGAGAAAAVPPSVASAQPPERSPGLSSFWQADDFTQELDLTPDGRQPPADDPDPTPPPQPREDERP